MPRLAVSVDERGGSYESETQGLKVDMQNAMSSDLVLITYV
jgi:hypothetical protein